MRRSKNAAPGLLLMKLPRPGRNLPEISGAGSLCQSPEPYKKLSAVPQSPQRKIYVRRAPSGPGYNQAELEEAPGRPHSKDRGRSVIIDLAAGAADSSREMNMLDRPLDPSKQRL
jgi:hypothetical protein